MTVGVNYDDSGELITDLDYAIPPHLHRHIYHVEVIINMDVISPAPCHKDAPLQLTHNLGNHLQISLMDTYQSPEDTPRSLQHKSPPPHCGRPLVRLRHERLNSHPHRTTTPNDNNLQTTPKWLRTHLSSACWYPNHRHCGPHATFIMAPLGRPNRQRPPNVHE